MGPRKIYWPRWLIFKLLEEIRKYEYLYNLEHPLYHNSTAKNDAYHSVLLQLKLSYPDFIGSIGDVKTKMESLRTQYRKEMQLCLEAAKQGARVYKPRLDCFSQIDFLRKYILTGSVNLSGIKIATDEPEDIFDECNSDFDVGMALDPSTLEAITATKDDPYRTSHDYSSSLDSSLCAIDVAHSTDGKAIETFRKSTKFKSKKFKERNKPKEKCSPIRIIKDNVALHTALQSISQNYGRNSIDHTFANYIKHEFMTILDDNLKSEMRDEIVSAIFEHKKRDNINESATIQ